MALPTVFTSGDVFTAANANLLRSNQYNKTTSTKTANYVLVAADVGTRVLMNAAGSTTITVNTSLFAAGDTLEISNIGAGVCTITSGTCTVTSSSSLALAQYVSGTLFFTSASAAIFIASAVTATAGGLVFINSATFSAVSTVSFAADTFTSTYDNYRVMLNITSASAASNIRYRMRAAGSDNTTSNYAVAGKVRTYAGVDSSYDTVGDTGGYLFGTSIALGLQTPIDIFSPKLVQRTALTQIANGAISGGGDAYVTMGNAFNATTSFDSMTIYPTSGTITGNYRVYGYTNS